MNPFEQSRSRQNWKSGTQRPRCANCKHAKEMAVHGVPGLECWLSVSQPELELAVFQTGANAICDCHEE